MSRLTDPFLQRHVRVIAHNDAELEEVVRLAEDHWSASTRAEADPGLRAVLFLTPTDLAAIETTLAEVAPGQPFSHTGRIPWIVTWRGPLGYDVIRNAAGFHGQTDADGRCTQYRGPVHGSGSEHTTWMETAVYYRRR